MLMRRKVIFCFDRSAIRFNGKGHITDNISSLSFIIPKEEPHKTLGLHALVVMVLQDVKVENRKYHLCLEYRRQIGLSKYILDELILKSGSKQN